MSTASLDQLSAAIVTALAADHGGGADAGLDLSGTGRVLRGSYPRPPRAPPFACVASTGLTGSRGKGYGLTEWAYTLSWVVRAWVPSTALDLETRVLRGEQTLQALIGALATAGSTPGVALYAARDLEFEAVALDTELDGGPETVQVAFVLSCSTSRVGAP